MYLEQAMFVGLEDEGEGIERQRRPEPDEAVAAPVEAGAETVLPVVAHQTVDAVGADQQVAVAAQGLEILLLAFEVDGHAARDALGLQDLQQLFAGEAAASTEEGGVGTECVRTGRYRGGPDQ